MPQEKCYKVKFHAHKVCILGEFETRFWKIDNPNLPNNKINSLIITENILYVFIV